MLVMVPNIKSNGVERAVVAIGFLVLIEREIVFLNPAGSQWVQSYREEKAEKNKEERFGAKEIPKGNIKSQLNHNVSDDPRVHRLDFF